MYRHGIRDRLDKPRRRTSDVYAEATRNECTPSTTREDNSLTNPALTLLFLPYPLKFSNKLHSYLLLPQVRASFDDD